MTAGSGSPFTFTGNVYLTGPYAGAPYGFSIVMPIVAGPFNLGTEVTRSKIEVDPGTARVTVTSVLPTIGQASPLRLRSIDVDINAQNYILNPTNCGVLATESTLTSTLGATQNVSSPFQARRLQRARVQALVQGRTGAKTSKANGASLETTINQPAGEANIKSVLVQLPKQLPSRLTTLQKACPEATFEANPFTCPAGSFVGGAQGEHADAAGQTAGTGDPRLPRRRGLPRPRPRHGSQRRARDRDRQHQHHERHHHDELRDDARRAGLEHHREPADGPALGAGGEREPLHRASS